MTKLIRALQIFLKYKDKEWPTNCSHDVLAIMGIDIEDVSEEDVKELDSLGFIWSEGEDCFTSESLLPFWERLIMHTTSKDSHG